MNSPAVGGHASYGYSDFFSSGFRSLTNRPAPVPRLSYTGNPSSSSPKRAETSSFSFRRGKTKRLAHVLTPSFRKSSTQPSDASSEENGRGKQKRHSLVSGSPSSSFISPAPSTSGDHRHNRRLSLGAFFDRRQSFVSVSSPDSRPKSSRTSRRFSIGDGEGLPWRRFSVNKGNRLSRNLNDNDPDVPEVWITKGGPYNCVPLPPESDDNNSVCLSPVDPFASVSSKSFYIDLPPITPPSPVQTVNWSPTSSNQNRRRESFLSLSNSSPTSEPNSFRRNGKRNRERPTSVQTMPAALTLQSTTTTTSRPTTPSRAYLKLTMGRETDTSESIIMEEDEESLSSVQENWRDSMGGMDWRQFHIELLG